MASNATESYRVCAMLCQILICNATVMPDTPAMPHILLADDDFELTDLLADYLQGHGLSISVASDGAEALALLQSDRQTFDLMVLDIMMPNMDGMVVLKQLPTLHATGHAKNPAGNSLPVIMLTAKGDDIDRIIGLELGADDYLGKPCNPRELLARIHAVLKRTSLTASPDDAVNQTATSTVTMPEHDRLTLDTTHRTAILDGQPLDLTGTEFDLLHTLLANYGDVVSKDTLSETVLGRELSPFDRSLDVHISRLRKKLVGEANNNDDKTTETIKSVRGKGYQLVI